MVDPGELMPTVTVTLYKTEMGECELKVEEGMRAAVRDIIDGALETVSSTQRSEWISDWPCQAILVAAFLSATAHCQEAIKGGSSALKDLMNKYQEYNEELAEVIEECADTSSQEVLSSAMIHDMYTKDAINFLIQDQVVSEKDYAWRSRPKYDWRNELAVLCLFLLTCITGATWWNKMSWLKCC